MNPSLALSVKHFTTLTHIQQYKFCPVPRGQPVCSEVLLACLRQFFATLIHTRMLSSRLLPPCQRPPKIVNEGSWVVCILIIYINYMPWVAHAFYYLAVKIIMIFFRNLFLLLTYPFALFLLLLAQNCFRCTRQFFSFAYYY